MCGKAGRFQKDHTCLSMETKTQSIQNLENKDNKDKNLK